MSEEYYDNVYLQLNIKEFEELKAKAKKKANEDFHGEDTNQYLLFKGLNLDVTNEEFKEGKIDISGSITDPETKKELGYIGFTIDMNLERVLEILQFYMKKLGKLKTVLEATKDE